VKKRLWAAGCAVGVLSLVGDTPPLSQPIPFSHKAHVALGVKCADCHPIKAPGFAAGLPKEDTCMACHIAMKTESPGVQKLAGFHKSKKSVPWVKVYRLPDYVWFSHEVHHKEARVSCDTCHGPVAEREVIVKERPITMAACMDCHKEYQASNACDFCHDPR